MKKILDFINNIKIWILEIISVAKIHYISLLFILLLYVLLWHVPQIKDLLIIINQEENHFVQMGLFFSSLTILAFLISSLNDYLNNTKHKKKEENLNFTVKNFSKKSYDRKQQYIFENKSITIFKENQREYIERLFPKVLGTLLIVIVAFAINHTYHDVTGDYIFLNSWQFFKPSYSLGFYLALFILLMSLQQKVAIVLGKILNKIDKHGYLPIIIGVFCLVIIGGLGFINKKGTDGDIENLFYATLLLAVFFFLITTSYNKSILQFKAKVGNIIIIFFTIVVIISYIVFLFNPRITNQINPLSIILINFITFFSIISLLKLIGKILGISLVTRVFIVLFLLGMYTASKDNFTHYHVSTVKTNLEVDKRLDIETYIKLWLNERKDYILQSEKFPVIFVSSEGGGSRAGLWSFLVHSYLYQQNPNYFKRNLFSLTGASGGGVGNAMFYTTANQFSKNNKALDLYNYQKDKDSIFKYKASVIYTGNYISSSVAAVMGRDFIKSIVDIGEFDDRGALVENEWEKNYESVFKSNYLGNEYLSIAPQANDSLKVMPLLMMNTTHLQSGNRFIMSPVKFTENKYMKGFRDFLTEYEKKNNDSTMIKISTSMLLNARFPYLSPVGKVKQVGQFGDAGYYDNIGGAVTRNLEKAFREILKDTMYNNIRDKIDIRHLLIANLEQPKDTVFNGTQLSAPLKMLLGATFAHPVELKNTYSEFLVLSCRTEITTIDNEKIYPILPLGRIMSKNGILSLEERLKDSIVKDQLDRLLIHK